MYSGTGDKADLDNHSNQMNPNNDEYNNCGESITELIVELITDLISSFIHK